MYLLDTNIWLERLLDQQRSAEVGKFIDLTPPEHIYITDFSFHSIGVILTRLKQAQALIQFVRDIFQEGAVRLVRLEPVDMPALVKIIELYYLDFDDAYQYRIAEKYHLILVSFDTDFDRTAQGRKTPGQLL